MDRAETPSTPLPSPTSPATAKWPFPARRGRSHRLGDHTLRLLCQASAVLVVGIAVLLAGVLVWKSWLAIQTIGMWFFMDRTWDPEPSHRQFGALAFIWGTIATSAIA